MTDEELLAELDEYPVPYEVSPMDETVRRFLACAECPKAKEGKCSISGVFVIISAKRADATCPESRW